MKRLLLALLAVLALPTAVNAESVWLVLKYAGWDNQNGAALEKIEMKDMNQCEMMGVKWIAARKAHTKASKILEEASYVCIKGK